MTLDSFKIEVEGAVDVLKETMLSATQRGLAAGLDEELMLAIINRAIETKLT